MNSIQQDNCQECNKNPVKHYVDFDNTNIQITACDNHHKKIYRLLAEVYPFITDEVASKILTQRRKLIELLLSLSKDYPFLSDYSNMQEILDETKSLEPKIAEKVEEIVAKWIMSRVKEVFSDDAK